jgi:hypothetical protein
MNINSFILNNFQILTKKSIIMFINVYEQLVHLIFYNRRSLCGTVLKSNRKIVERGKIDTPNTETHDRSLSWLSTGTSIKRGRAKLVLLVQTTF